MYNGSGKWKEHADHFDNDDDDDKQEDNDEKEEEEENEDAADMNWDKCCSIMMFSSSLSRNVYDMHILHIIHTHTNTHTLRNVHTTCISTSKCI